MIQEETKEFVHSWYLLIMTLFSLLFFLINQNLLLDLPLLFFMFAVFFKSGPDFSILRRILFFAFFFSFGFFVLNVFYPAESLKTGEIYRIFRFEIYYLSLVKATHTMIRLFLVSLLSMSSGVVIDYTRVILYLIVHKGLRAFWGYPILIAINSIALFKKEFERIKINAHLRGLPFKDRFFLFFPLLVFAIRYSQRGALSLVTRGLNDEKSFYFSYDLSDFDRKILKIFWVVYLIFVTLMIVL